MYFIIRDILNDLLAPIAISLFLGMANVAVEYDVQ